MPPSPSWREERKRTVLAEIGRTEAAARVGYKRFVEAGINTVARCPMKVKAYMKIVFVSHRYQPVNLLISHTVKGHVISNLYKSDSKIPGHFYQILPG